MNNIIGSRKKLKTSKTGFTESTLVTSEDANEMSHYLRFLLFFVALLIIFGITMLYSASYMSGTKYFRNQFIWMALGSGASLATFMVGYRRIAKHINIIMIICFIALLAAAFLFDPVKGASRWIRIPLPGFRVAIQPSEFAKIAITVFVAKYCSENFRTFNNIIGKNGIIPLAFGILLMMAGVIVGKDLGTTVLIASIALAITLAGGLHLRYLAIPLGLGSVVGLYIYFYDSVRMARVVHFIDPEKVKMEQGYQLWHSLLALGSGNWFGVGFLESRLKQRYLPEAHNDFILAVVGEELGFIAIIGVVLLFILFTWYAIKIALLSKSRMGMLIAFGVTTWITVQAIINLAVVSGAAPTKGMPAPFISYGGSSIISSLIGIGLLSSVAFDSMYPDYNKRLLMNIRNRVNIVLNFLGIRKKI